MSAVTRALPHRHHLIELHEQPWFPALWRKMFQQSMGRAITFIDPFRNCAEPFSRFLHRTRAKAVLDLCSGSAEPLVHLRKSLGEPLREADKPTIVISDLYPNVDEFRRVKKLHAGIIDYYAEPVDALSPPPDAPRVRTMFNALHHFTPEQVRTILRDAAKNADGIAIFESTSRTLTCLLMSLPNPLVAGAINGFMLRPYRVSHLLWGVLVPVLPFTALVDGMVSSLRSYTVGELRELTRSIDEPDFEWEIGTAPIPRAPIEATYVFGWRRA